MSETALIVGAGSGLSASLARLFHKEGMQVALAARQTDKLDALCAETDAKAYACDASSLQDVEKLFSALDTDFGSIDTVVYNPSARVRGQKNGGEEKRQCPVYRRLGGCKGLSPECLIRHGKVCNARARTIPGPGVSSPGYSYCPLCH